MRSIPREPIALYLKGIYSIAQVAWSLMVLPESICAQYGAPNNSARKVLGSAYCRIIILPDSPTQIHTQATPADNYVRAAAADRSSQNFNTV